MRREQAAAGRRALRARPVDWRTDARGIAALQRLVGNSAVALALRAGTQSTPVAVVQRFDPRHHRSALVEGLKNSGFSADDVGAIYAANWERDFSQVHPSLAGVVVIWKRLKAALLAGDHEAAAIAGAGLEAAVAHCIASIKDITKASYGGNPFYSHMDNPVGSDLDPDDTWWPWEKARRQAIRDQLLRMTPDGVPRYLDDARSYVNAQLIRAAESALGLSFTEGTYAHFNKTEWARRERELATKVPPPEVASATSPSTAVIAEEATADAKKAMKPGYASLGRQLPADAVDALGRASHALEDFWAHSNFVDIAIGYDADNRRAATASTDTTLRTGTFGPASQKHSISHKMHAIAGELWVHPLMGIPQARRGVQALSELATKLEHDSMAGDVPGSHTRLAKDQPSHGGGGAEEKLKDLRFNLAHRCAIAANREVIGGMKNVIAFGTADPGRADAHMLYVTKRLYELVAPPTPSHPLWLTVISERANAAALLAQLP